jgi:integrase
MTMDDDNSILPSPKRTPWNKGKLIGAKPPLLARHVWSIRTKLQIERRARELAMFNLAIDSKLRGCDVVAMKVEDVAPNGYPLARATVRQRKTGRPVRFELTEQTRQAIDDYLKATGKVPGEFLFTSRRRVGEAMTTRQYARLVAEWIAGIGLDPHIFATHSLRRTKATLIYRRTGNLRSVQLLATRKWKVRSDISESRSMMRLPSRSKSKSEVSGQSGHCSARLLAALRDRTGLMHRSK